MEGTGRKLDDVIVRDSFLEEGILVNKRINFFASIDPRYDNTTRSRYLGPRNQ